MNRATRYTQKSVVPTRFSLPSAGGGILHCLKWEPLTPAAGIVQIVHGIAEHAARYQEFATWLAGNGFLVVAEDHMGHGSSWVPGTPKGYFSGGWSAAAEDVYRLYTRISPDYPGIPYVIFGHSMGSFLTRALLYRYPACDLAGAVLSGTAWFPAPVLSAGIALSRMICRLRSETHVSNLLHGIMFSGYLKKIKNPTSSFDWLSTDPRVVRAYEDDPMCGFVETCGLDRDMLYGIRDNQTPSNLNRMKSSLPVLLIAGLQDPVGNYGTGVRETASQFLAAGMNHVQCIVYPNSRHEVLNDCERQQVYRDFYQWFLENVSQKSEF